MTSNMMQLIRENPVKAALQYVEEGELIVDMDALTDQRAHLVEQRKACLPIEVDARDHLDEAIVDLDEQIAMAREVEKSSGVSYPRIHLDDPLRWYDGSTGYALPKLATFRLTSPTMMLAWRNPLTERYKAFASITSFVLAFASIMAITGGAVGDISWWWSVAPVAAFVVLGLVTGGRILWSRSGRCRVRTKLPAVLHKPYREAIDRLIIDEGRWKSAITCTARFTGAIPQEVKGTIAEARATFGNDIYLVAEANWAVNSKVNRPISIDPLVIGVRGNLTYLITSFDLTPLENLVAAEFAD